MIAEIISIGDELTSGQRLDTNSQWISQQLGNLGIQVVYHTTVADLVEANIAVFRNAMNRAEIVVATGGLGPTADDLTRQSIAEALGVGLYRDPESLEQIQSLFSRRNRAMPAQNVVQADFPEGSVPLFNPNGSAPGILLEKPGDRDLLLMAFPGVPAELREMFAQHALPRLTAFLGERRTFLLHKPIRCFGIGESELESRLPELFQRGREPQVGITASAATITLRNAARGTSDEDCKKKIDSTESIIRNTLGNLVFGTYEQELQHVLFEQLQSKNQTLSFAEVGTGGYLSHLFSEIDKAGSVFVGSSIGRTTAQLLKMLGTASEPSETARHLAEKTRALH
ncbi:MAG: CinA family nicotinamide mononucleotide deamidase-related protein, partial [Planctomycetota bacterium]|nr:CinA family nicotinamide mononucleotide deamidase-related protein [Planctomycetota bacterium]